jgi:ATP-binding cassette subfamily B protein
MAKKSKKTPLSLDNAKEALRHLRPALALVWQSGPAMCMAMLAITLVSAFVPVVQAYAGKLIVDSVMASVNAGVSAMDGLRAASPYLALEFALILLGSGLGQLRRYCGEVLNHLLGQLVSAKIMWKASRLDMFYFETPEFYDRLQSARRETEFRAMAIMNASFLLLQNVLTLTSFVVPIIFLSPWVAAILFCSTLPAFVAQTYYSRLSFRLNSWSAPEARRMAYYEHLLTVDSSAKEIKLFGLAKPLIERHTKLFHKVFNEDRKLARRRSLASLLYGAIASSSFYVCYGWAVFETAARKITLGQMTFYLASFRQLQGTFSGLFENVNTLYENGLFMQNLFGILDLPERDERRGLPDKKPLREEGIEFRNVSFRYKGLETWALRNVSFHVRPGEKVALVGANGSGKTTLIKLLTRLYEPTEGEIFLYGLPLDAYSDEELTAKIGVIFQDFVRYQTSLKENVGFGSVGHLEDLPRMNRAVASGGAKELVDELEGGWEAMLGGWFQKGRELSGGQWQKIALSRAFMRDSEILVLDEPTAALDAAKEHEIFARFKEITKDRIAFLVSHRFSTVRMADMIVVMNKGEIQECGSHKELMAKGGTYAQLFELQAEGYR